MLSDQEKEEYLVNTVLPVFKPLSNQKLWMGILDYNLRIRWITEDLRLTLGLDEIVAEEGFRYSGFPPKFIQDFCKINHVTIDDFFYIVEKVTLIMQRVITKKVAENFVILLPFVKSFQGYARTDIPILHPSGEVLGIQVTVYPFSFFGIHEFINILNNGEYVSKQFLPESSSNKFYDDLKLSPRQKEVLFLVSQGISQDQAAQMLGIKRGTLSKIISDQICPKFNIFPPHYIKLLDIVHKEGLDRYIPKTLWRTYVLELTK